MINELSGLSEALSSASVSAESWHKKYLELPKVTRRAPLIRIWLGENGVSHIERLPADTAPAVRKYGDNQGTFPAMNILPLFRITDDTAKRKISSMMEKPETIDMKWLRMLCTEEYINWTRKFCEGKFKVSMYARSSDLQQLVSEEQSHAKDELVRLIELLLSQYPEHSNHTNSIDQEASGTKTSKLPKLHYDLTKLAFEMLEHHKDEALALTLLFHLGDQKYDDQGKKDSDTGTLSVVLDLDCWNEYGYPIASSHFTKEMNQMLLSAENRKNTGIEITLTDAFGTPHAPDNSSMPSVRLAAGFDAKIYTMFHEKVCQDRYRNFEREDASYPLALENRTAFASALNWITRADQEGKTWLKVEQNEVLIAYPSSLPEVPMQFTAFFGAPDNSMRFTNLSGKFISTLKGLPAKDRPENIYVFVLRRIDKGRTKVLYSRETKPENLKSSALNWQSGCKNRPKITSFDEIEIPFPLRVAPIVNQVWYLDQNEPSASTIKAMKGYQGVELLLGSMTASMKAHYLGLMVRNNVRLAVWYGNVIRSKRRNKYPKISYNQEQPLFRALTVIGLLLYLSGYRKEQYMENYPFALGRMLQISDSLHALYCTVIRKGEMPSQLVGSTLYNTAAELPLSALSQLGTRMNPYLTWAKIYARKNEEESKHASWYLKQYRETADLLIPTITKQTHFNDYDKAQLMLGYLGSLRVNDEIENETDENVKEKA